MDVDKKLYVITGGPGVGKTTLIKELSTAGFSVVSEDAIRIIKQQIQENGEALPWKNKELYAQMMLEASIKTYQEVCSSAESEIIFFDRGILDTVCYMNMENIQVSPELEKLVAAHPYNQKVFILPPWKEIYNIDNERKQTWEEAVITFDRMRETYNKYGYKVIELPKTTTEKRLQVVEASLSLY